jgi:hypothetical protein
MICGAAGGGGFAWPNFRYRSSSYLTEFFRKCDLDYAHNGFTRKDWVIGVLEDLNFGPATDPSLPSDSLLRVFSELMDTDYFDPDGAKRKAALGELNGILARDGLEAYIDGADRCHIRNIDTQASSASARRRRRNPAAVIAFLRHNAGLAKVNS